MTGNPVVELAKERNPDAAHSNTFIVDGVQIRLVGVPSGTIQDAMAKVNVPEVPLWYNPDKGREEPNPNDPSYAKALELHAQTQSRVATDAMVMFGSEIDPDTWPPQDDRWIKRLKLSAQRGILDLDWVDWDDDVTLQYLFLKHRAMTNDRILQLGKMAGLSQEAIAQAKNSFQR